MGLLRGRVRRREKGRGRRSRIIDVALFFAWSSGTWADVSNSIAEYGWRSKKKSFVFFVVGALRYPGALAVDFGGLSGNVIDLYLVDRTQPSSIQGSFPDYRGPKPTNSDLGMRSLSSATTRDTV